jgi:hypothetical protein
MIGFEMTTKERQSDLMSGELLASVLSRAEDWEKDDDFRPLYDNSKRVA